MSDEILDGVVRPGPPPADAVRPEVVIQREDGTVTQAVVHLPDGTAVEISAADRDPGPVFIEPDPWACDLSAFKLDWRMRQMSGAHLINPRDLIRITGT
jgi:hypothetical protein